MVMSEENKKEKDTARFGVDTSGASRARNRTVLLTPETVGKVRSALSDEEIIEGPGSDPISELLPPTNWDYAEPRSAARTEEHDYGASVGGYEPVGKRPTGKMANQAPVRASYVAPAVAHPPIIQPPPPMSPPGAPISAIPRQQKQQPLPRQELHTEVAPHKVAARSKLIGFLVSYDKETVGEVFEVRVGRWLLTSRPTDHSEYILVPDESISPLHAIVRGTNDGKVQVLDQLSEFGTGVIRAGSDKEEEVVSSMINVSHGDIIRFGKRYFTVCIVPDRFKVAEGTPRG
jgi:hypothetical protein